MLKSIFYFITLISLYFPALADGHGKGKIHLEGFGSWSINVMNAGNGNLSITYDGLFSGMALNGTKFANNTSIQCLGGLTTSKGKFTDESGFCKFLFSDGDTAFIRYLGSGQVGKSGSAKFEFIGGTGKLKNISGEGTVTRTQIKAAMKGFSQSRNIFIGNYSLK